MGKTKLFFIRHGESQANERGLFLGHADLDLTARGKAQAERTAQYLKDVPVDAIYSSDLLRAYHTAEATATAVGLPIHKEKALREIHCGEWEKQPFTLLNERYEKSYGIWRTNIGCAHPEGGESVMELQTRVVKAVEEIAKANEGKTVFLFTHATPIRVFAAFCKNKAKEEIKDIPWATNASVTSAEYEDGTFTLVAYGMDEFMGDMLTALPKNV